MKLHSPDELTSLAAGADPVASAFAERPYLLVDTDCRTHALDPQLPAWLRSVPAPVIAVGQQPSPLAEACDLQLTTADELAPLLRNIKACPITAAVLVQTLRLTQRLDVADGLVAESLAFASLQNGAEFRRWHARFHAADHPPAQRQPQTPAVAVQRDGDHLCLLLDRADQRNAMTVEMRDALLEALSLAITDDRIISIELAGRGRCFSVGGDLREFGSAPDPATAHAVRGVALPGRLLHRLASRTTARVHGACIGSGIEFPAFAARMVATPDAWFQLPELKYGLIPGAGGTVSISRRIGRQRTAWLALSCARIDARTALAWGLVDHIAA